MDTQRSRIKLPVALFQEGEFLLQLSCEVNIWCTSRSYTGKCAAYNNSVYIWSVLPDSQVSGFCLNTVNRWKHIEETSQAFT
jgi:hypothetical protein